MSWEGNLENTPDFLGLVIRQKVCLIENPKPPKWETPQST